MTSKGTHRSRNFSPLREKSLVSALVQLLVTKFGYGPKVIFAEQIVEHVLATIDAFVKPASLLKPGQMLWIAVADDGRKHTFKSMKDIPQVPVILDVLTAADLKALADDVDFTTVRRRRHARLLDQAYTQGGALAHTDLSAITLTPEWVVAKDIARTQEDEDRLLPHRGTVHDVGPTLTHKTDVARLLEAGYLEPDIARKLSPVHNLRSVERYAQVYKNVIKLLESNLAPGEISGILSISQRLLDTYIAIVYEHHPEIIAQNPYVEGPGP